MNDEDFPFHVSEEKGQTQESDIAYPSFLSLHASPSISLSLSLSSVPPSVPFPLWGSPGQALCMGQGNKGLLMGKGCE